MSMTLISINVAPPAAVAHGDASVTTGIFKQPVSGPVAVRRLNLDGDGQADLRNHGGADKAVYAYSLDHYAYWRDVLGRDALPHGQFGENLTVAGLDEAELCVGDQLRIGDARFAITQPRVPCFKLGIRLADASMPKRFTQSLRTGFYLRVLEQGTIEAGNAVDVVARGLGSLSIRTLFDAYLKPDDPAAQQVLARALDIPELSAAWRSHITERLARRA
ncbi:MAG: MOSC domain-containing protein [Xanthomonadaceae bacterium]|jgi:MOSC domain-containing protein YiiM|nr:MOSC domain-containing protein [Xanthomonadaceae bacterium]MDE3073484.1 MOSC domain-containing protein [Pseudomonadota bacterium]